MSLVVKHSLWSDPSSDLNIRNRGSGTGIRDMDNRPEGEIGVFRSREGATGLSIGFRALSEESAVGIGAVFPVPERNR